MYKITATDFDTQPTKTQEGLTCALKDARLLPDGYCYLNVEGNEKLFRINIYPPFTTVTGLDGESQWLGLPRHRTSH